MKKEPLIGLKPLNDCVLVELKQSSKNFNIKEGKYDSRTEGIVIAVPQEKLVKTTSGSTSMTVTNGTVVMPSITVNDLVGKRIHFEEFKEGARIKRDGKMYSFIKIEDIRGYENE